MNKGVAFIELEQKVEQLVNRYSQLRDENDALKREVGFLRQENQRLQTEQKDVEEKVTRILQRVKLQESSAPLDASQPVQSAQPQETDLSDDFNADASRYENSD